MGSYFCASPKAGPFRVWARRVLIGLAVLLVSVPTGLVVYNHLALQRTMNQILKESRADPGRIAVHFERYIHNDTLIFDVRSFQAQEAGTGLLRVFYELASALRGRRFETVEIAFRGKTILKIDGESFQTLGDEYGKKDMSSLNRRLVLAAQLPGGRRLAEVDKRLLAHLVRAVQARAGR